jgi:DNA-directed RNA polymerase subunit RPC12/RpoP
MTCDYCKSSAPDGVIKCANCGAPISHDSPVLPDYRSCPACHRKLLALGSPACSYCGRRLPDEYIKAREEDLKRITEVEGLESAEELGAVCELLGDTRRKRSRSFSDPGVVDITSLIDFFS